MSTLESGDGTFHEVGNSDPVEARGCSIAQKIKGTPGITAWSLLRVHIDEAVRDLDVDSRYPGGVEAPKGRTVRPPRPYVSWV